MKTLFVCSETNINDHVGEEYDSILEVPNSPTTETIQEISNRLRNRIRGLWVEDKTPEGATREVDDPQCVAVYLSGPSPYNVMLQNLKIMMRGEESIEVELPYLDDMPERFIDEETQEVIDRLDNR